MGSSSITIASNIASLSAQRRFSTSTSALESVFTRLASGQRINTASDDPAGLAVSASLRADTRIYNQARRNLNDGLSYLNVADATIEGLSGIVVRIQELAEQSANGTLGSTQRASLDAEAQALKAEYMRISETASFNGRKVFDTSASPLALQAGYGANFINTSLGGSTPTGTFGDVHEAGIKEWGGGPQMAFGDINADGITDMVKNILGNGETWLSVGIGNGDGTFKAFGTYRHDGTVTMALGDLNGDGYADLLSTTAGYVHVRMNKGDGTFTSAVSYTATTASIVRIGDFNNDGDLDFVAGGGDNHVLTVRLGAGDGAFGEAVSYEGPHLLTTLDVADVNNDGKTDLISSEKDGWGGGEIHVRLGQGDGTFANPLTIDLEWGSNPLNMSIADFNRDGNLDFAEGTYQYGQGSFVTVQLGNGNGTFSLAKSYKDTSVYNSAKIAAADINGDGKPDIISSAGTPQMFVRFGMGDGTFGSSTTYDYYGTGIYSMALQDLTRDGGPELILAGLNGSSSSTAIYMNLPGGNGVPSLGDISLRTAAGSLNALTSMKTILDGLSSQRGRIGAVQSRLMSAISTLGSTIVEYSAAAGRISDADFATETANLVRQQILQQAGAAVLSQANRAPAVALTLLSS